MIRAPQQDRPRARKRFGQHFLHDPHVIQRIIDNITIDSGNRLIEIGPGTGALTYPLLKRTSTLDVIEIDHDLADRLEQSGHEKKLHVHREDVLKFDFCKRFKGKLNIVGNLPYNISTPVLFHLLDHLACIDEMILMLQKEVAERICAGPGSHEYGRLSIMLQSMCVATRLFTVRPGSFTPVPKVESAVIRLVPRGPTETTINDRVLFSRLVRTAFSYRRKTMRNALKGHATETELIEAGIDPGSRPEVIAVDTFALLANILHGKKPES